MSTYEQNFADDASSSSDDSILLEKEFFPLIEESRSLRLQRLISRHLEQITFLDAFVHYNIVAFRFLVPSFLHHRCNNRRAPVANVNSSTSNTIAALDGLRGVACLIVFNFHFLYPYTTTIFHSYGAVLPDKHPDAVTHYHQLAIIPLLYRGRAMVAIFFATSGYVLSRKFLQLIRTDRHDTAYRSINSAIFRRGFRLFVPVTAANLMVVAVVWLGLYEAAENVVDLKVGLPIDYRQQGRNWITGYLEPRPLTLMTLYDQLADWYFNWSHWINPFSWEYAYPAYDPHAWTIPSEFRSSMIVFLILMATAGLRERWRLALITVLFLYTIHIARTDVALFLGGVILAQIDLMSSTFESPNRKSTLRRLSLIPLTILGLYLLSFPDGESLTTPGYRLLASLTPTAYNYVLPLGLYPFWHSCGALLTLHCVTNSSPLRRIFERPFCQYFGKISFAFYLVHGPLLYAMGLPLMPRIWRLTGYGDGYGSEKGFAVGLFIGWCILVVVSVWLADIFWRVVDVPSTRLARYIERYVSEPAG